MGLAEDLKALQDLREKGELSESAYAAARDKLLKADSATRPAPSPVAVHQRGGPSATRILLVTVLVVFILFMGINVAVKIINNQRAVESNGQTRNPVLLPPRQQQHSVPLTNGALTVNANSLSWYSFTVPPNTTNVGVNGHFTATGGTGNDIVVYIADEDAFANLKNGHQARVYYNSQKVTQATISAVLPNTPATYYLVFDNRFSLLTPKAVQVNATLTYMQ